LNRAAYEPDACRQQDAGAQGHQQDRNPNRTGGDPFFKRDSHSDEPESENQRHPAKENQTHRCGVIPGNEGAAKCSAFFNSHDEAFSVFFFEAPVKKKSRWILELQETQYKIKEIQPS